MPSTTKVQRYVFYRTSERHDPNSVPSSVGQQTGSTKIHKRIREVGTQKIAHAPHSLARPEASQQQAATNPPRPATTGWTVDYIAQATSDTCSRQDPGQLNPFLLCNGQVIGSYSCGARAWLSAAIAFVFVKHTVAPLLGRHGGAVDCETCLGRFDIDVDCEIDGFLPGCGRRWTRFFARACGSEGAAWSWTSCCCHPYCASSTKHGNLSPGLLLHTYRKSTPLALTLPDPLMCLYTYTMLRYRFGRRPTSSRRSTTI